MARDKDVLLTNLAQMKVLADARRLRILELLCEERTTKQVAEILRRAAADIEAAWQARSA